MTILASNTVRSGLWIFLAADGGGGPVCVQKAGVMAVRINSIPHYLPEVVDTLCSIHRANIKGGERASKIRKPGIITEGGRAED